MVKEIRSAFVKVLVFSAACALLFCGAAHAKPKVYPTPGTVPDRADPRPGKDSWAKTPFLPTYRERQLHYLGLTADKDKNNLFGAAARAMLGRAGDPVPDATIDWYVKDIAERSDCTDFTVIRVVLALYLNEKHPFLSAPQRERLKQTLLGFKYWVDEPGSDRMISWTENHQILFNVNEYLAGQLFPDDVFTNNGQTGAWHREHGKKLAMRWMKYRSMWGFSEWDSIVYYNEDMIGVVTLAEFARDADVATAASIITDLLLFDIGSDLFYGYPASSHGRAYDEDVLSGRDHSLVDIIKVVWGLGIISSPGDMGAFALAATEKYAPSDPIIRAGQDNSQEFTSFERHGIPLNKVGKYGIRFDSLDAAPTLWGMGAYSQPEVIDLLVRAADKWDLWSHPFFDVITDIAKALPRDGSLGRKTRSMEIESNRTLLGEVNKLTFRTPNYMLSSAQDYRAGERGNQHHIWQATLSPDALVFTTNPGSTELNSDRTPDYWAGQNRLPRVAQYKNLAIILYNIDMKKALGERQVYDFTHAFFPKWAFDEVFESKNWIFGHVGDSYVALYTNQPYIWKDPDDPFVHDAVAAGKRNVWICRMGERSKDGTFEDFRNKMLGASLVIKDLDVTFTDPDLGAAAFSWKGKFTVASREIALSAYKLFDNPYGQSDVDSGILTVTAGTEKLTLDFPNLTRKVENTAATAK